MPLTPQDVQNKLFTKTFRGYDMEEVDGFLDEVEAELGRLLRDNNDLRVGPGPTPGGPSFEKAPTSPAEPAATPVPTAPAPAPPAPAPPAPSADAAEVQQAALRVLGMAEQTLSSARLEAAEQLGSARTEAAALLESARTEADATLLSARTEADETLGSARAEAERLRGSAEDELEQTLVPARAEAERLVTEAREEADTTLTPARAEAERALATARAEAQRVQEASREQAERALADAHAEAERLSAQARAAHEQADAELSAKVQGATQALDARRAALESHIEDLRSFEREYRSRLKAYLVSQLGDLEGRVVPEDAGAGVPTTGRNGAPTGDLDLSDDAPDMVADADREVPLGQRSVGTLEDGAPGVGPFRSGPDQGNG